MKKKVLSGLLFLSLFLPGLASSGEIRLLTVELSYSGSAVAFILYKDGVEVCVSDTPDATQMDCYVEIDPFPMTFVLTAVDADGVESPQSEPYVLLPPPPIQDTTSPLIEAFNAPALSSSLVVPITEFAVSDAVGVAGYKITESTTAPLALAKGWSAFKPASYSFLSPGEKRIYGWAKDAAGNVSLSRSAVVTITLTDTLKPTVETFTIPATASSLVVPITSLTASDNLKVTGYKVTASASPPAAAANGWHATLPVNYSFLTPGSKTLYAWAKDAAGNVTLAKSAPVTITLADSVKPTVNAFTIPTISNSLVVPITTLTAMDNIAVTGYKVTCFPTAPRAGAGGWTTDAPINFTSPTPGAKTLYAWAKDATGNVSLATSAPVFIHQSDTIKPLVTAFTVVADAIPLTARITLFTVTDNVSVTGYQVTTTATVPKAGATGWAITPPTTRTFPTAGVKKLYAWVKDAAGNVSLPETAVVTVAAVPAQ